MSFAAQALSHSQLRPIISAHALRHSRMYIHRHTLKENIKESSNGKTKTKYDPHTPTPGRKAKWQMARGPFFMYNPRGTRATQLYVPSWICLLNPKHEENKILSGGRSRTGVLLCRHKEPAVCRLCQPK